MTASAAAPGAFHALALFHSIVHTFIHPHFSRRRPSSACKNEESKKKSRAETRRRRDLARRHLATLRRDADADARDARDADAVRDADARADAVRAPTRRARPRVDDERRRRRRRRARDVDDG